MKTPPERIQELYRMGYRGTCDGHDDNWQGKIATNHSEMNALRRGSDDAKKDAANDLQKFIPDDRHR